MRWTRLKIGLTLAGSALAAFAASAPAEVVQSGNLRVSFEGGLAPRLLPRTSRVPVAVTLTGRVITTDRAAPPQLRTISLAINRNGKLDHNGLPACKYHQIQPASTPSNLKVVPFPFARASFGFEDGRVLTSTLVRSCKVQAP